MLLEPVHPLLGSHDGESFVSAVKGDARLGSPVVLLGDRVGGEVLESVIGDPHGIARLHVFEPLLVEGGSRDAHQKKHDSQVHHVTAIALLVRAKQVSESAWDTVATVNDARPDRTRVFLYHRGGYECREGPARKGEDPE